MGAERTDHNIPILCGDCSGDHAEDGYENFRDHLIQQHGYNIHDAQLVAYANMQDAYDREDLWQEAASRRR